MATSALYDTQELPSASTRKDFEQDLGDELPPSDARGFGAEDAVHFCLLAEFDIDAGATLAYQYPYPTGTDEHRLAELMLPDGAHLRQEDWTVFYLGQTSSSAVDPMLEHQSPSSQNRLSNTSASMMRRKSGMANDGKPREGIAGNGLLYVLNIVRMKEDKSMRRGAQVKALALCSPYPYIGIFKALLLLAVNEYFANPSYQILERLFHACNLMPTVGMPSLSRAEKMILRASESPDLFEEKFRALALAEEEAQKQHDEARGDVSAAATPNSVASQPTGLQPSLMPQAKDKAVLVPKDTHFFETRAYFQRVMVPIRIPMTTFEEDVGDYSLIELVTLFANGPPFPGPFHPHLHTNGTNTNPVILIINAMIAHKRVLFLGHNLPANHVSRMVLAACAMASGCGQVLRGVTETAFPYANLASLDILEELPGFVAGVINPRFEELHHTWDVLCNLETGRVTVSKDIFNPTHSARAKASDSSLGSSLAKGEEDVNGTPAARMNAISKPDYVDNIFIDEVVNAIQNHLGESNIRLRFTDYLSRFVTLAAFQEYTHTGSTKIGYPSVPFKRTANGGILGSGAVFADESIKQRELWANGHRIDAWRRTKSYRYYAEDWQREQRNRAIGFDIEHQITRLRICKDVKDAEAHTIFAALAESIQTYEQVVELISYLPLHLGGLIPIANGLFHRSQAVKDCTVDLLETIRSYPIGAQAVANLNYLYRKALITFLARRQAVINAAQHPPPDSSVPPSLNATPQGHS